MELRQQLGDEFSFRLKVIEDKAGKIWEKGELYHTYYTLHGMKHSNAVISILDRLVAGLNDDDKLEEIEIFCLLSAVYLHDIGMQCKYPDDEARIENISKSKNKPYTFQDLIRDEHHLRSGRYIIENLKILDIDQYEAECVRLITEGHRKENLYSDAYENQVIGSKEVRVRLLAALLRLADELDIDYRRAPEILYEIMKEDMPEFSQLQWLKHYYTNGLIIEPVVKGAKKKLSIEIHNQYPKKIQGNEITEILILKPIMEKVDELQKIFLEFGLKLDLSSKLKINTRLSEMPDYLIRNVCTQYFVPSEIKRAEKEQTSYFESQVNIIKIANPQHPKLALALLLDTSDSMYGTKIEQVNKALTKLKEDIINDDLARKRVEIAVITFGRKVKVVNEFLSIEEFTPNPFEVNRSMAEAISLAIDLVEKRKKEYKLNGVDYYRPWIFLITDGKLDDIILGCSPWDEIIKRIHDGEKNKMFSFFTIGIEPANMDILRKISPSGRPALILKEFGLKDMFLWLSSSLQTVSRSCIGEQITLENPVAPSGWGELVDEQISFEDLVAPSGWGKLVGEQISFEDPVAPTGWDKLEDKQILLEDSITSIGWVDIEKFKLKLKENEFGSKKSIYDDKGHLLE